MVVAKRPTHGVAKMDWAGVEGEQGGERGVADHAALGERGEAGHFVFIGVAETMERKKCVCIYLCGDDMVI